MGAQYSHPDPDLRYVEFLEVARKAITSDCNMSFVGAIRDEQFTENYHYGKVYTSECPLEFVHLIFQHRAIKCATSILEGEARFKVPDLNVPWIQGLPPLHLAARNLSLDLTKLFLLYGAHPNLGVDESIPLCLALEAISCTSCVTDWSVNKSPVKLIYILCIKELREALDTIKLLASRTANLHKISLRYAEKGEVVQLTALLLVAWDKLVAPYSKKGVEYSPIGQCISKEIEELPCDDQQLKSKLECARKILNVFWDSHDRIEEYLYRSKFAEIANFSVPLDVAYMLNGRVDLDPDQDLTCDDVQCLKPSLKSEEADALRQDLRKVMHSGSPALLPASAISNNILSIMGVKFSSASRRSIGADRQMTTVATAAQEENEDLSDYDSDDVEEEITDKIKFHLSLKSLIEHIEDENSNGGLRNWLESLPEDESVYTPFKTVLHSIQLKDEHNFIQALIQLLSNTEYDNYHKPPLPPLHKLAMRGSFPRTIALLLHHGEDPNIRVPYKYDGQDLLRLPLCVALLSIHKYSSIPFTCSFHLDNAPVRLISYLCSTSMMKEIETVRLLASKTKDIEIDQTIKNCMRKGRVEELCVLMLLGYHSKVSSLVHFFCDESPSKEIMEQLVDIFERIGYMLVNYLKYQGLKGVDDDRVILDIASLLSDAGHQVTSKDILPTKQEAYCLFDTPLMRMIDSVGGRYAGVKNCSIVNMFQDFISGYRHKDACSVSKNYKYAQNSYLSHNTRKLYILKPIIYRCPPIWFRVLWRATKFS